MAIPLPSAIHHTILCDSGLIARSWPIIEPIRDIIRAIIRHDTTHRIPIINRTCIHQVGEDIHARRLVNLKLTSRVNMQQDAHDCVKVRLRIFERAWTSNLESWMRLREFVT